MNCTLCDFLCSCHTLFFNVRGRLLIDQECCETSKRFVEADDMVAPVEPRHTMAWKVVKCSHLYSQSLCSSLLIACVVAGGFMTLCIGANAVTTPKVPKPPDLPDWAQAQKPPPNKALLVGINNYQFASHLATPAIDAALVAAALKKVDSGFNLRTVPANQLHRDGLLDAFQAFAEGVKEGDVALVFYSGHGLPPLDVTAWAPSNSYP